MHCFTLLSSAKWIGRVHAHSDKWIFQWVCAGSRLGWLRSKQNNSPFVNGIVAISHSILLLLFCFANNIFVHSFVHSIPNSFAQHSHPKPNTGDSILFLYLSTLGSFSLSRGRIAFWVIYTLCSLVLNFDAYGLFHIIIWKYSNILVMFAHCCSTLFHHTFPFLSHFNCLFPVKPQITFRLHTYYLHVCE